jgi:hypothetical protein
MRKLIPLVAFGILLLLTGCPPFSNTVNPNDPSRGRVVTQTPTAPQLVAQLNATSQRLQSIECRDVWIDAKQGIQPVGLPGYMICQKNRNFRLTGKLGGKPAVDIGSNEQEFWFWISQAEPPGLYYCSYADLESGRVRRLPFPFQPSWVMEALGMADREPNGTYEPVKATASTFELIQNTVGTQGQPVRKVTVFRRNLQVAGHRLEDASGREICTAQVLDMQQDQASGTVVPKVIQLTWKAQELTMKLRLDGVRVNGGIPPDRAQAAFSRPRWQNIPAYDLAGGADQPTGQVQRAGAYTR